MTIITLISMALATWRISSLFVEEYGPWDILLKFRSFIGITFDEFSNPTSDNVIGSLFTCVWCLSLWVGFILTIIWIFAPTVALYLSLPFALSAAAIIIEQNLIKE